MKFYFYVKANPLWTEMLLTSLRFQFLNGNKEQQYTRDKHNQWNINSNIIFAPNMSIISKRYPPCWVSILSRGHFRLRLLSFTVCNTCTQHEFQWDQDNWQSRELGMNLILAQIVHNSSLLGLFPKVHHIFHFSTCCDNPRFGIFLFFVLLVFKIVFL